MATSFNTDVLSLSLPCRADPREELVAKVGLLDAVTQDDELAEALEDEAAAVA